MIKIESKLALRSYKEETGAAVDLKVYAVNNEQICAEIVGIIMTLERNYPVELSAAIHAILEGVWKNENN